MLVTTFVFLGIEGASVYSRLARRREDVGRATLLGFVSTLALFALGHARLVRRPAAARPRRGDRSRRWASSWSRWSASWGETFINVGVIISVLGAYLAWTLLNAEVMFMPARTDVMPRVLARESANGTPIAALVTTNLSVQVFLLLVLVVDDALDFMLKLDTALTLVPYLLAAAYAAQAGAHPRDLRRRRGAGAPQAAARRRRSPSSTRSTCCTPPARSTSCSAA